MTKIAIAARPGRRVACAALLLAAIAAPLPSGPAQAQGLLDFLFAGQPRQQTYVPAPTYLPDQAYDRKRARAARELRRMKATKTGYARLPKAGETDAKATPAVKRERGAILDTPGALKAVLNDPTLRPGDIVMFPSGPRVFTGASRGPHRMSSFEAVDGSRLVSKETRTKLSGLAQPTGGSKLRLRGPAASVAAAMTREPAQDGPRVVYRDSLVRR